LIEISFKLIILFISFKKIYQNKIIESWMILGLTNSYW